MTDGSPVDADRTPDEVRQAAKDRPTGEMSMGEQQQLLRYVVATAVEESEFIDGRKLDEEVIKDGLWMSQGPISGGFSLRDDLKWWERGYE